VSAAGGGAAEVPVDLVAGAAAEAGSGTSATALVSAEQRASSSTRVNWRKRMTFVRAARGKVPATSRWCRRAVCVWADCRIGLRESAW